MKNTRTAALALCLSALLTSCTWKDLGVAKLTQESHRTNLVINRPTTRALVSIRAAKGNTYTARLIGDQVKRVWAFDRIWCPAGGIPGCDTTSEYVYKNPGDLGSALDDVRADRSRCLTLTVLPPYNWTHKGSSTGCFG